MTKNIETEIEDDAKAIAVLKKQLEKLNCKLGIRKKIDKSESKKVRKRKAQKKYDKGGLVEKILGENVDENFLTGLLMFGKVLSEEHFEVLKRNGKKENAKNSKAKEITEVVENT